MARDRRLVRIAGIGALVAFAGWGEQAEAQRPDPHLAYAYPAGCQLGSYSEITLGGQYLKDAKQVYIAGKGVQVEVVRWYRPMERGEYQGLRMAISDARDKLIEQRQGLGKSGNPRKPKS